MKFYAKRQRKPTIIVVTMIDIFCVLLIFFIVATTFRRSVPAVTISLPEASEGTPINQTEPLVLSVSEKEKIFLNAKEIPLNQLNETLAAIGKQSPQPLLAMEADKKASFGLIIKVMDAAKAAGFKQLPAFVEREGKVAP